MPEEQTSTEQQTGNTEQSQQPNEKAETSGYTPPATQDEFNRVIDDRLKRERAKFGDYDDLKAKAAKYDEQEQANLSEVEKANARAAKVEDDLAGARAESARLRVALKHGLSEDDAKLLDDLRDEEAMSRLAERLAKQAEADDGRVGFSVDNTNRSTTSQSDPNVAARQVFGI